MKTLDYIRKVHNDDKEAVGEAMRLFNNRRKKDSTVTYEDMQLTYQPMAGLWYVIIVLSYDDDVAEAPKNTARRFIGMPVTADPLSVDHSDN